MLAAGRGLLAGCFLLAFWFDATEFTSGPAVAYALLGWYAALSAAYLIATWNDWWLERRLGGPAHAMDLIAFASLVALTNGYTSPFFPFSIFLILSAALRWGWREAALTTILVALLYLLASLWTWIWAGQNFSLPHFIIGGAYLTVFSALILWSDRRQRQRETAPALAPDKLSNAALAEQAAAYAAEQLNARRCIFAWWESEEPWINVSEYDEGLSSRRRFSPREMPCILHASAPSRIFLFDCRRGRLLAASGGVKTLLSRQTPFHQAFVQQFAIAEGLRIPINASQVQGELLVMGAATLSSDALELGESLASSISAAFERGATLMRSSEAAVTSERLFLARDLHDSVTQFLAGVSMRLEGIRKSVPNNPGVEEELDSLQEELKREQKDLRNFIIVLRGGRGIAQMGNLSQHLESLTARLAHQWHINCIFRAEHPTIQAPAALRRAVDLLIREALSNAVRHGKAKNLSVRAQLLDERLQLEIADDGHGFPVHGDFKDAELRAQRIGPWSLHERVQESGGNLHLKSGGKGSCLTISLPLKAA
ncbi:MAG TPA: histidine kinase [Allosphingosinicella sp.]|uniref:sensor histidine kinase n=1 Tax=Allosphingosinicella sp. TaxID=2823234 RepID=UPI002EDA643A